MRDLSGKRWSVSAAPEELVQAFKRRLEDQLQAKTRLMLRVFQTSSLPYRVKPAHPACSLTSLGRGDLWTAIPPCRRLHSSLGSSWYVATAQVL